MKLQFLLFLFLFSGINMNAQTKYGYINTDSVILFLPEYNLAMKYMESYIKPFEDSLIHMQTNLEDLMNFCIGDQVWDSIMKKKINDSLKVLNERINNFQLNARDLIEEKKAEEHICLISFVKFYSEEFCLLYNLKGIADKNAVLYCIECVDYTDEFIGFLKKYKLKKKCKSLENKWKI